ncbi:DNA-binding winged helix-turn-helix (wHTH) domain-containing protein [Solimonas aquatica]|uniref:DNA-binding winged helix-turn-helix (WHTH) domain-containing protein n=1 Tax=Solimonas aquatica TaxID=489703 RepID=A0A1H9EQQ8_9GAMM|nr:winged helix-turn-helix domain-containing protein [Solimonas aquatica]SEQ27999.1 DNA-binding winged helix-turn-helix (wHTH) domain-containing protein [Solimonas aquatica]
MDSAPEASEVSLQIGEWIVRNDLLRIESASGHALLEPRPMQLLLYLAERPFRVIAPDQLLADIWGGTFYGDAPLQRAVAMLRRALGDCATAPRYIQTVRKRGYRLIAPVCRDAPPGAGFVRHPPEPRSHSARDEAPSFARNRLLAAARRALLKQAGAPHNVVLMLGTDAGGRSSLMYAGLIPLPQQRYAQDGLQATALAQLDLELPREPRTSGRSALRGARAHRAAAVRDGDSTAATARRHRLLLTLGRTEQLSRPQDPQAMACFAQILDTLTRPPAPPLIQAPGSECYHELPWALPLLPD